METFAKRIARLRVKRGLTQKDVALALKVPLSTYKEWEYGRSVQGEKIYVDLAEILQISLRRLLTGESDLKENATLNKVEEAIHSLESVRKALLSSF